MPEYLLQGVIGGLATTALLTVISLISKPIRSWILYDVIEYKLDYDSDFGKCQWDLQWELERFGLNINDAHNDHLEGVEITLNRSATWSPENNKLSVSKSWSHPKSWPVGFRLKSVVRTKPQNAVKEYILVLDIRKRKSWF